MSSPLPHSYSTRPEPKPRHGARGRYATDEEVQTVRRLAAEGLKNYEIAERFGRSHVWVYRVCDGVLRPDAGGPVEEQTPPPTDWCSSGALNEMAVDFAMDWIPSGLEPSVSEYKILSVNAGRGRR